MAVVGRVFEGEKAGVRPLAGQKYPLPGHEYPVEHRHRRRLAITGAEFGRRLAGPTGGPGDEGEVFGIHRHGAAHRVSRVGFGHVPPRHHQQLVQIGSAGNDRLDAGNDDAVRAALDDADIGVGIGLLAGPAAAVALAVGHRHAERQVFGVHPFQIGVKAFAISGAEFGVHPRRGLPDRGQPVAAQIALRAAGFLAHQPHRLQLVEQILGRRGNGDHPVHRLAAGQIRPGRAHQRRHVLAQSEVIG